jgi:hypothetical protein
LHCSASGSAGKTPSGSGSVDTKKKEKESVDEEGEPVPPGESPDEDDWGFTEVRFNAGLTISQTKRACKGQK